MGLIKTLFPHYALKREVARLQLQNVERAYDAGKHSDFHKIISGGESANEDMQVAGVSMRSKARYFDENLDIVVGLFDTLVNNVVGNTNPIRPLVRNTDGTLNTAVNLALLRHWEEFSVSPTLCGQYSMVDMLKLACRSWLRDGEYLTRFVRGRLATSTVVPLALELIEADYLPYEKEYLQKGKPRIVQGIEFNRYNQVVAYHLLKEDPSSDYLGINPGDTRRIKADDIIHLKFTRRTHQARGVTILHSVMNRLDDLKDYEESERIAARVAAAMTGYIQKPGEQMGNVQADGSRTFEMSPGMIFDNLLPGETVNTIASNRPNPALIDFRSAMLRAVASGTGSNYSTISKDYNGTYSSQRQELLESKPSYQGYRKQFVDSYLYPIWREFLEMLQVAGKVDLSGVDPQTIDNIEVHGINIGWIDPKKQADAMAISIQTGVTTRGQVIRDSGGDPDAVFAEIKEEEQLFGPLKEEPKEETNVETDEQDQE